jgi:hypothetical protein
MTFWTGVAVTYVVVIALGLSLGRYLAERFQRPDGGGRTPAPAPEPFGPSHALDACPPLGSAFDRAFLPGVFDEQPAIDLA